MPNYVTKMSKSDGSPFDVMDKEARTAITAETEARVNADKSNETEIAGLKEIDTGILNIIGDGTKGIYSGGVMVRAESYGYRIAIDSNNIASVTENGRNSQYQRINYYAVTPGKLCSIGFKMNANNNQLGYVFVDQNNKVLANCLGKTITDHETTTSLRTVVPENAEECWVCSYGNIGTADMISFPDDFIASIRKFTSEATKNGFSSSKGVPWAESEYYGYHVTPTGIGDTAQITQTGRDSAYNRCVVYGITPGKIYRASIRKDAYSNQRGYIITDANNVVLYNGLGMNTESESFLAPENAAKCMVISYGDVPALNELTYEISDEALYDSMADLLTAHLDSKIADIKQKVKQQGAVFGFVTDTHFPRTYFNSLMGMLRRIIREAGVKNIFYGGDALYTYLTGGYTDLDTMIAAMEKQYRTMNRIINTDGYFYPVKGNHDFVLATDNTQATGETLSNDRSYNIIVQPNEHNIIGDDSGFYYYVDNPKQKIRYIVIDQYDGPVNTEQMWGLHNGLSQEQYDWLINKAFNVDGYGFVVFTHAPSDSTVQDYDSHLDPVHGLMAAINAKTTYSYEDSETGISFEADFTGTTSYVIANIAGHTHADRVGIADGVLCVTTTCEAALDSSSRNTDITVHAFDIYIVDKAQKRLVTVRLGYGSNRTFSYDSSTIGPVT